MGDGDAADFLDRGEDGGYADHLAAVVADGLHGGIRGIARGDAGQQDQHMLIGDHGHGVFTEDQLAAGGMLRGDDVEAAVLVAGEHMGLHHVAGHAGADDFRAVQAEDGVHRFAVFVDTGQLPGHGLGLAEAELLGRNVDIIVGMAVVGGEMPLADPQHQSVFLGGQLDK